MHTFISGGCKNGKSYYAQHIARAQGAPLYYVATMISTGAEDDARIARLLFLTGGVFSPSDKACADAKGGSLLPSAAPTPSSSEEGRGYAILGST